jgi:hypothetical protein
VTPPAREDGARGVRVHERALLDALSAIDPEPFRDEVWRIVRKGRDPLRGSSANGRWSPGGEFDVLYTSLTRAGALAEIGFRLSLEPVWPSRMEHTLHRIAASADRVLHILDVVDLAPLGVDVPRYESFDYAATQAIASAAHFLEFDGLRVPSARADCHNLVLFLDRIAEDADLNVLETEAVDWETWRRQRRGR